MPSAHEAVAQAISFLTTPLSKTTVSPSAINLLQSHLTASLLTLCARSPLGVSLRLASASPPPECIGRACEASGVNWSEWLFLIGGGMGLDLDVNVTATAVTASFCRAGTPSLGLVTVWQQEEPTRHLSTRELLYADDDSEELFNEINRSQHSPSWLSSWGTSSSHRQPSALTAPVPVPKMQAVPMGAARSANHSRSSSYASSHHSGHSPNSALYNVAPHQQQQGGFYPAGMERAPSACSNHSSTSLSSSRSGRSSEDGSTGSSGALSWTRRGTVVPGPQQNAILQARQAHAQQQQLQAQQQQFQQRHSPSASITSLASLSSTSSGSSKHRRQRSTTGASQQQQQAVVDPTKASVTAYDGGKTKVMTGGVMLGSVTSGNKKKRAY
ncbi:hypothetical protein M408DRAFT_64945 [Serendipita vermifera MAFF 305830]|uniref:Anti-proliferative protein domain-containing protein n=1 Tax=Serendipita vermifera MAFF 305830 TaxID=933852 RepID=A0A0C2WZQ9_SERVB|nr:hypothetical protein M408DRAFT_64945 [Serendipita vermifera MAFF 305830]